MFPRGHAIWDASIEARARKPGAELVVVSRVSEGPWVEEASVPCLTPARGESIPLNTHKKASRQLLGKPFQNSPHGQEVLILVPT